MPRPQSSALRHECGWSGFNDFAAVSGRDVSTKPNMKALLPGSLALAFSAGIAVADGLRPAPLPEGAPPDPWSLEDAAHTATELRDRWCLNGLWGFRPPLVSDATNAVPGDGWGWAKIPSVWDMADSWTNAIPKWKRKWQDVFFSPDIARNPGLIDPDARAWYCRTFTMPPETAGRRVVLTFTMLNTHAVIYVDGVRAAEVGFPGGEADITAFARPGEQQTLALDVTAYPLSKETTNFNAPDRSSTTKTVVKRQGITGDLFLDAYPAGPRIAHGTVECDVGGGTATFVAELGGAGDGPFSLVANVIKGISTKMKISCGDLHAEGKHALICVCNGRFYGGGFNPSLDASINDGLLDILVVKDVSLPVLPFLLGKYASGHADDLPAYVTHLRGTELTIELEKPDVINIDGEAITTDHIHLRLLPKAFLL